MKNIKIILTVISVLCLFSQCTDKYYLDEQYTDSYNLYGENLANAMQEYYISTFKYPKTIDNIIKFNYDLSMSYADLYNDSYGFYIKQLTNLAKNSKLTQEEREKSFFGFAAFNFICMYKDYISINVYDDSITVSCDIDNRNIFKVKTFKQDKCNDRYDFDGFIYFRQNNHYVFLDTDEYPIAIDSDFRDSVLSELKNIAKNYSNGIVVHKEDRDYWKVAILSYKRNSGLSSLCPDDDIDLINDPFISDVKSFLSNLLNQNPDIYEIIIPITCMENKKQKISQIIF
ncbi:MAG: hypothetical protein LBC68_10495 [Prevotellaceae bacterium]|jgi:hypothetical protein|nr:hypothetical protein [Prevotellaceae bacterium]